MGGGQEPESVLTIDRTCEYVRGGHCLLHGGGAIRKFRGGYKMIVNKKGVRTKRYQREYYYECEPGRGDGRLQTRLSFRKMTLPENEPEKTTFTSSSDDDTSTEGQNRSRTKLE